MIYGAGGLGREVLSMLKTSPQWEPLGFIDDTLAPGTVVAGLNVAGGKEVLVSARETLNVVMAVGDPRVRAALAGEISNKNVVFPSIIHPSAILQDPDTIRIGKGTIISAGCVLTTNIRIGDHTLVNLNVTVGHDVEIGNYSSVMPGVNIAGEVVVGASVLLGSGSNIMNRVRIGDGSRVGMGSVVIRDVAPGVTVAGVPAKPLRQ